MTIERQTVLKIHNQKIIINGGNYKDYFVLRVNIQGFVGVNPDGYAYLENSTKTPVIEIPVTKEQADKLYPRLHNPQAKQLPLDELRKALETIISKLGLAREEYANEIKFTVRG